VLREGNTEGLPLNPFRNATALLSGLPKQMQSTQNAFQEHGSVEEQRVASDIRGGDRTVPSERGLLSEHIRVILIEEITTGQIPPRTVLDEAQIGERFKASRTPVREALRQLEAAGLVEIRPRRGVVVLPLTRRKLSEMFEVTAEVEAMCARFATNRITALERYEIIALHESAANLVEDNDVDKYDEFNIRFHDAIYKATHNNFLIEQASQLRVRLLPFRRTQLRQEGRVQASHAEHNLLVKAMTRGDSAEAAIIMREHMLNASDAVMRFLVRTEPSNSD
jgi:DNA-binding GntR family transcriptional regulator